MTYVKFATDALDAELDYQLGKKDKNGNKVEHGVRRQPTREDVINLDVALVQLYSAMHPHEPLMITCIDALASLSNPLDCHKLVRSKFNLPMAPAIKVRNVIRPLIKNMFLGKGPYDNLLAAEVLEVQRSEWFQQLDKAGEAKRVWEQQVKTAAEAKHEWDLQERKAAETKHVLDKAAEAKHVWDQHVKKAAEAKHVLEMMVRMHERCASP